MEEISADDDKSHAYNYVVKNMNLNQADEIYTFCDGSIISIKINYNKDDDSDVEITLQLRKKLKGKYIPCVVVLILSEIIDISLFEDMKTGIYYSDIKLFETNYGYYISLDPYGGGITEKEEDNMVFKSGKLKIIETTT